MTLRLGTCSARFVLILLAALVATGSGIASAASRVRSPGRTSPVARRSTPAGEYVVRGPVKVLAVTPFNPAGNARLGARLIVRIETGRDGLPDVVLTHVATGQTCRFDAEAVGGNRFSILPQPPCRFKALSSPGQLSITRGSVDGDARHLRFEGTMDVRWLSFRGTIAVAAEGNRTR